MNALLQPFAKRFFGLRLRRVAVERIHRHSLGCELDESARNLFFAEFRGNEEHEPAIFALVRARGIPEVRATGGFLEDIGTAPRSTRGAAIPSPVEEVQFCL